MHPLAPRPALLLFLFVPSLALAGGPAPDDLRTRLAAAIGAVAPEEAAVLGLPETRSALGEQLAQAGVAEHERVELVEVIVRTAQGGAWQEPLVAVGPFALTVAQVRAVAGPREGRDRVAVAARLRRADPLVAAPLTDDELLALVPEVVAADLRHSADALLERVRLQIVPVRSEQ